MRNGIVLLGCIIVFATVMAVLKYSVLPYIIGSYGLLGIAVFIGACFLIAHWIDRRDKERECQQRNIHSDPDIIDAEFTVIHPAPKISTAAPRYQPSIGIILIAVAVGIVFVAVIVFPRSEDVSAPKPQQGPVWNWALPQTK